MPTPSLRVAQTFFFEASLNTYAGVEGERRGTRIVIPEFPNAKAWLYEADGFRYVDKYFVSLSSGQESFGETVIWYEGNPIGFMQYRGYYPESVSQFLKSVLRAQYLAGFFWAGRGAPVVEKNGLYYRNTPTQNRFEFARFETEEKILQGGAQGEVLGRHYCAGFFLP